MKTDRAHPRTTAHECAHFVVCRCAHTPVCGNFNSIQTVERQELATAHTHTPRTPLCAHSQVTENRRVMTAHTLHPLKGAAPHCARARYPRGGAGEIEHIGTILPRVLNAVPGWQERRTIVVPFRVWLRMVS